MAQSCVAGASSPLSCVHSAGSHRSKLLQRLSDRRLPTCSNGDAIWVSGSRSCRTCWQWVSASTTRACWTR